MLNKHALLHAVLVCCSFTIQPSPEGNTFGLTFFGLGILSTAVGIQTITRPEREEFESNSIEIRTGCDSGNVRAYNLIINSDFFKTNTVKGSILAGHGLASLCLSYYIFKTDRVLNRPKPATDKYPHLQKSNHFLSAVIMNYCFGKIKNKGIS